MTEFITFPKIPRLHNARSDTRRSQPQLDRIDPSIGYVSGNVEWICMRCNRRKQDLSYVGMIMFGLAGVLRTMAK